MFQYSHFINLQDLVLLFKISFITVKWCKPEVLSTSNLWVLDLAKRCVMSMSKVVWLNQLPHCLWGSWPKKRHLGNRRSILWFAVVSGLLVLLPVILLLPHTCFYSYLLIFTEHPLFSKCVTHFIFKTILRSREFYLHFTDQETKAQRSISNFPMTTVSEVCSHPKKSDWTFWALSHYPELYYSFRA